MGLKGALFRIGTRLSLSATGLGILSDLLADCLPDIAELLWERFRQRSDEDVWQEVLETARDNNRPPAPPPVAPKPKRPVLLLPNPRPKPIVNPPPIRRPFVKPPRSEVVYEALAVELGDDFLVDDKPAPLYRNQTSLAEAVVLLLIQEQRWMSTKEIARLLWRRRLWRTNGLDAKRQQVGSVSARLIMELKKGRQSRFVRRRGKWGLNVISLLE